MASTAWVVLALDVRWLSGESFLICIISMPVMLTGIKVIWRSSSCTCFFPNISILKVFSKVQSKGRRGGRVFTVAYDALNMDPFMMKGKSDTRKCGLWFFLEIVYNNST